MLTAWCPHLNRRGLAALRRISLGEGVAVLVFLNQRAVDGFLKDGFGVVDLKLGLEVFGIVGYVAAVGAATGVGEGEFFIRDFILISAPN